jgi:hypothetical protein
VLRRWGLFEKERGNNMKVKYYTLLSKIILQILICFYATAFLYAGCIEGDCFNGQGTYTWADGRKYIGQFKDGKRHGQGTYTYADGTVEHGIWEKNKFMKAIESENLHQ